MSPVRLFITFPLHESTVSNLNLTESKIVSVDRKFDVSYRPDISKQQSQETSISGESEGTKMMCEALKDFNPDVLMVGNNTVPKKALRAWQGATNKKQKLRIRPLIIRRGVETGNIPCSLAKELGVDVKNIPGINSPYVARHMINHINEAIGKPCRGGMVFALLGAGNIGLPIMKEIMKLPNATVKVYCSSLDAPALDQFERYGKKVGDIIEYLNQHIPRLQFGEPQFCNGVGQAIEDANIIVITMPWVTTGYDEPNEGVIGLEDIKKMALNATIVSASNPRIFTTEAMNYINEKLKEEPPGIIFDEVRIDTGHSHAKSAREKWPNIDTVAGEAFYETNALVRLDRKLFELIAEHFKLSPQTILNKLKKPNDDREIEPYVVDKRMFYGNPNRSI